MKKLFTIVCTLVLGGALTFAQTGGTGQTGSTSGQTGTTTSDTGTTKGKKHKSGHHKGGKKSKKNSGGSTTPPPK